MKRVAVANLDAALLNIAAMLRGRADANMAYQLVVVANFCVLCDVAERADFIAFAKLGAVLNYGSRVDAVQCRASQCALRACSSFSTSSA